MHYCFEKDYLDYGIILYILHHICLKQFVKITILIKVYLQSKKQNKTEVCNHLQRDIIVLQ